MAWDGYFKFVLALAFVLGLILLLAFLVRRFGLGSFAIAPRARNSVRRLSVVEVAPIDAKRRLVLVRRDDVEHLILLGAQSELLIESNIPTTPQNEAVQRADR